MVTCFFLKFVIYSFWNTQSRASAGRAAVPTLQPHGRSSGPAWTPQVVPFPAFMSLAHLALITDDVISCPQCAKTKPPCWAEEKGEQFSLGLIQSFGMMPPREREALDMQPLAVASVQTLCRCSHLVLKNRWAVSRSPHGHHKNSLTSDTAPNKWMLWILLVYEGWISLYLSQTSTELLLKSTLLWQ